MKYCFVDYKITLVGVAFYYDYSQMRFNALRKIFHIKRTNLEFGFRATASWCTMYDIEDAVEK